MVLLCILAQCSTVAEPLSIAVVDDLLILTKTDLGLDFWTSCVLGYRFPQ